MTLARKGGEEAVGIVGSGDVRRIASGLAWVGRALFEPSRYVNGVVERRRARMLPKLQLAHAAQLLLSVNLVAHAEKGATAIILPRIFLVICGCILVCYALSRTRRMRLSLWGYAVIGLAFSPVSLVLTAPTTGSSPLMFTIFLVPPVLLINAFVWARAALTAGLLGLMPTRYVLATTKMRAAHTAGL